MSVEGVLKKLTIPWPRPADPEYRKSAVHKTWKHHRLLSLREKPISHRNRFDIHNSPSGVRLTSSCRFATRQLFRSLKGRTHV